MKIEENIDKDLKKYFKKLVKSKLKNPNDFKRDYDEYIVEDSNFIIRFIPENLIIKISIKSSGESNQIRITYSEFSLTKFRISKITRNIERTENSYKIIKMLPNSYTRNKKLNKFV